MPMVQKHVCKYCGMEFISQLEYDEHMAHNHGMRS